MSAAEVTVAVVTTAVLVAAAAYICYDNLLLVIPGMLFAFPVLKLRARSLAQRVRWKLNLQFCDAINCLSAAMEAGYSVENALSEAYSDMKLSYNEDEPIMTELKIIIARIANNVPVEEAFLSFGERSGIDDIRSFADVFATAKRTGGNIIGIIRSTASVIHTGVELKRDLRTVVSAKKYESDIMKVIPFAVLLYLKLASPDMIACLYGNAFGIVFMSVVLVLYAGMCALSDRVVRIEI